MSFQELYFVYSGDNRNTVSAKVLNKINAFIFIADFRNLKLLWTNRYCSNKLGFSSAELLNMTSDEILWLVHPECREILINSIKNILNSRDESKPGFLKIRTKGNRWIWIMLTFRIFEKSRDGKINKVLSYAIEVDIHQLHNQLIILTHKDKAVDRIMLAKPLSAREKEVIELISNGESDKEISENLSISIHTAKTHRKKIIRKLGLKNSRTLIKYAIENGLS